MSLYFFYFKNDKTGLKMIISLKKYRMFAIKKM